MALDQAAPLGEPARGGAQAVGVGMAALGLEATPVERQGREVEQLEPCRRDPVGLRRDGHAELAIGELDLLEPGATEAERVTPLADHDRTTGEGPVGAEDRHRGVDGPVAADQCVDRVGGHGVTVAQAA